MQRLNQDSGVTFFFFNHDHRVMDRAHRLIRLRDGKVETDEVRR